MNKQNILFGILGLFLGLIGGFILANSLNRGGMTPQGSSPIASTMPANTNSSNANIPPGHPDINKTPPPMPDIQPAIDNAKKNPNDFEAQLKVAEIYNQGEKYTESAEYLLLANKLKPDHYPTIVNLGNVYFDGGDFDNAEKWYRKALELKKDDANVRTDLGLSFVFREKPDYDKAIQEFESVLQANPTHIQALQNLTVAFLRKGDGVKAKETIAKLETADPQNSALAKLKEQLDSIGKK